MPKVRCHERIACKFHTSYQAGHMPTWWWGTVADVCPQGLRLKTHRPLDPGTLLEFDLSLDEPRRARVIHVVQEETTYAVGCSFLRPLTDEEFEALQEQSVEYGETWHPVE